jgi:hypothetical protein
VLGSSVPQGAGGGAGMMWEKAVEKKLTATGMAVCIESYVWLAGV